MKVVVLYRPYSESGRVVEEFAHEYMRRYPEGRLEMVNIDSRDGSSMASIYDIVRYPAILALRNDGSALTTWEGDALPLLDEVAGYMYA